MKTHWLKNPNKNYLGHWDIPETGELVATIMSAGWEDVKNPTNNKIENKRVIRFEGNLKPLICNQTNAKSIIKSTGIRFMEDATGHTITMYVDKIYNRLEKQEVDCIRIRNENQFTHEKINSLYNQKKSLIPEKLADRAAEIINNKEVASYPKLSKELKKL